MATIAAATVAVTSIPSTVRTPCSVRYAKFALPESLRMRTWTAFFSSNALSVPTTAPHAGPGLAPLRFLHGAEEDLTLLGVEAADVGLQIEAAHHELCALPS